MGYLAKYGVRDEVESLWSMVRQQGPQQAAVLADWATNGDLGSLLKEAAEIGLMEQLPAGEWQAVPLDVGASAAKAWWSRQADQDIELMLLAEAAGSDSVHLMVGMHQIRPYIADALDRCKEVLQGFDIPPYATPHDDPDEVGDPERLAEISPEMALLLRRGVEIQTIYDPSAITNSVKRREITTFMDAGETAKVGDAPGKVMIFDRREVMMSVLRTYENKNPDLVQAVWTDHPALVEFMNYMWEKAWAAAKPYPDGPGRQNSALTDVARCLYVSGLSQAETARQLNLSVSSIRRYKDKLRNMLGAKTTDQVGWLLATRGLSGLDDQS